MVPANDAGGGEGGGVSGGVAAAWRDCPCCAHDATRAASEPSQPPPDRHQEGQGPPGGVRRAHRPRPSL